MSLLLVVTPRELVAEGLRTVFNTTPQLRLLKFTGNSDMALKLPSFPAPDLILYDAGPRPWLTLAHLRRLQYRWRTARCLVLVAGYSDIVQAALLNAGLPNWSLDNVPVSRLVERLLRLVQGTVDNDDDPNGDWLRGHHWRRMAMLSPREHTVLEILAEGYSNKEVADQLGLREATVKSYLRDIYSKLQVANRVQAVLLWRQSSADPDRLEPSATG